MLKTEKEECQKDQAVGERGKGEEKMKKERWAGEGSKLLVILSGIHSNQLKWKDTQKKRLLENIARSQVGLASTATN